MPGITRTMFSTARDSIRPIFKVLSQKPIAHWAKGWMTIYELCL
jgi:hypothetical protein